MEPSCTAIDPIERPIERTFCSFFMLEDAVCLMHITSSDKNFLTLCFQYEGLSQWRVVTETVTSKCHRHCELESLHCVSKVCRIHLFCASDKAKLRHAKVVTWWKFYQGHKWAPWMHLSLIVVWQSECMVDLRNCGLLKTACYSFQLSTCCTDTDYGSQWHFWMLKQLGDTEVGFGATMTLEKRRIILKWGLWIASIL